MPENPPFKADKSSGGGFSFFVWEVVKFVFLALIIVVPIRVYVAQPYIVSGSSMVPTFHNGDYLIVDQLSYRFDEPDRGDVVIFKYPKDPTKFFIKRVIALPRETLEIREGTIIIKNETSPDGFVLPDPYNKSPFNDTMTITLQDTEYFVMGDNREASLDSRSWGALPRSLLVGKTFARLFPFYDISFSPELATDGRE